MFGDSYIKKNLSFVLTKYVGLNSLRSKHAKDLGDNCRINEEGALL